MKLEQNVIDFMKKRYEELERCRGFTRKIIEDVQKKFKILVTTDDVRNHCTRKIERMREKIQEVNDSVEEKQRYEVVDGHYVISRKDQAPFRFTIEQMNEMFKDYSKWGNGLTEEEMITKYTLHSDAWNALKRAFRLNKKSNVISPFTVENTSEGELDEMIEEATAEHIDTIKEKMVKTHEKRFKEEAKRAFKTLGNIEYFLKNLHTFIDNYTPIEVDFIPEDIQNNDIKHFVISDIHIGKTNTKDVINRLNSLHSEVLSSPERIIYITCLGDLVETIAQGGMHSGQIEYGMDHEFGFGFDLMLNTVTIFEKFFLSLHKAGKHIVFNGITGNHGRMTSNKEYDINRTGELVIFELIKRGLQNVDVEINYHREVINKFGYDNLSFLIYHGDGFVDKQKPEQIIVAHGEIGKHSILLSGDKHSLKFSEGKNYTYVKVPALAGQGKYDKDMNLHSLPGYIVIKENEFGIPDITIKRLK